MMAGHPSIEAHPDLDQWIELIGWGLLVLAVAGFFIVKVI